MSYQAQSLSISMHNPLETMNNNSKLSFQSLTVTVNRYKRLRRSSGRRFIQEISRENQEILGIPPLPPYVIKHVLIYTVYNTLVLNIMPFIHVIHSVLEQCAHGPPLPSSCSPLTTNHVTLINIFIQLPHMTEPYY